MDDVVVELRDFPVVSMKSGLRDRNNVARSTSRIRDPAVSMKSGLRDRNNTRLSDKYFSAPLEVSMKSGLRDRNNPCSNRTKPEGNASCLNEVRS